MGRRLRGFVGVGHVGCGGAIISTMLSQLGTGFLMMLTFAMVFVTGFGVYIIFRTAPSEGIIYQNRRGPKLRQTSITLTIHIRSNRSIWWAIFKC